VTTTVVVATVLIAVRATSAPAGARTSRPETAAQLPEAAPAAAPATPAPLPSGDFAFLATDGSRPVRYDPCTPVHYMVNLALAPAGASTDVQQAVRRISDATGLSFVYDGTTDEVPQAHRGIARNSRYPGWPPVLIAWVKPGTSDLLSGGAIGEGGSTWFGNPGSEVYVTGVVAIDASQNAKLTPGFGGDSVGSVLLHELGHVVGLDHVADTSQIMFATVTEKPAVYGPGDLAGLAQLGRGQGCLRHPAPTWAP
jgi:hypothetical protein